MTEAQALKIALQYLRREKFLLLVDNRQPSLVTLFTGEPVQGSWFGHPMGKIIYNTSNNLGRENLLSMKIIDRKYTFISADYRDFAYALTKPDSEWQKKKLTPQAAKLLKEVEKKRVVPVTPKNKKQVELLEKLLLASGESQHTPSGKHIKVLLSWEEAARRLGHKIRKVPREEAERAWELRVNEFNRAHRTSFRLPWQKR